MCALALDSLSVTGYGDCRQDAAITIYEAVESRSLGLSYNADKEKFSVVASSGIIKVFFEELFNENAHVGMKPRLFVKTDENGNRIVKLEYVSVEVLTFHGLLMDEYYRFDF